MSILFRCELNHQITSRYFQAYLNFFKAELDSKSIPALLEEYIFESRANFDGTSKADQPEMLNRFHDGLLHPHIHTGFGVEFGLPGIFAEGNFAIFLSLKLIRTVFSRARSNSSTWS